MWKKLSFIFMIAAFLVACNAPAEKDAGTKGEEEMTVLSVDEVLASADDFVDQEIIIHGMVTHVCKHGGQKLFISGKEEGISLRINTSEQIAEFDIGLEGSELEFNGVFKVMTEEFKANAIAEHEEHHGTESEEDHEEEGYSPDATSTEKTYYMIAYSYKDQ